MRLVVGETMIATETAMLKLFGFVVGQEIKTEVLSKNTPFYVEIPTIYS